MQPYSWSLKVKNLRSIGEGEIPHFAILPHELLHALHKKGGTVWHYGVLGPDGDRGLKEFWSLERTKPWCKEHPALQRDRWRLGCTIPVGLHGDGVADVKKDKIITLTWNSVLSRASSWSSRWLYPLVPQTRVGKTTLEDNFKVLWWSLRCGLANA